MILDRLGILSDEVSANLTEALDWVVEQGLKHVEIRVVNGSNIMNLSDEEVADVLREVKSRGLFVSGIASPIFKCALDPDREVASGDVFGQAEESVEAHFEKLARAFEIARLLETKRIRIFSFWREREPEKYEAEIVAHLKKAAALAEKADVQLLLENEPSCNGGFAAEVGNYARLVNSPVLKVLWDPGNEAYGGFEAFPTGYNAVKDQVAHVHIKDALTNEQGEGKCVPVGQGNVAFVAQLEALQAAGYDGLFTIETHYIPEGGVQKDGSLLTLQGLRALLA